MSNNNKDDNTITGLALGGGAVHGVAHIGVLEALLNNGIEPDHLAGTSIGALIAGLYSFGTPLSKLKEIARELDWLDVSALSLSKMGLLSNEKLGDLIRETLGEVDIEDSPKPLSIMATNLSTGEKVVFREGSLAAAVMASTCIPGIFIPVETDDKILVDGGLVENVPVTPLRDDNVDKLIAVDINALRLYKKPDDIIEVVVNAFDIAMEHLAAPSAESVDLLIRPELTHYSRTDTDKVDEIIKKGYETAVEALESSPF